MYKFKRALALMLSLILILTIFVSCAKKPKDDELVDGELPGQTEEPLDEPTDEPTEEPSDDPNDETEEEPTQEPNDETPDEPSDEPTAEPTDDPSKDKDKDPSKEESPKPTKKPAATPKPNIKHPSYLNLTGFPIVKEPITLEIMVNTSATQPDFNKVKMFQEYEKMTGIKIKWINIPSGATRERVNMAFAANSLPDAFLKCGSILDNNAQYTYASDGMILNLMEDDRLKNFAPNFYEYYSKNASVRKSMTFPDGAVYSFPQGVQAVPNKVAGKLFINQKWLDNLGLKMPKTTEELYNVLKAFKENDANGNGIKNDEIPLSSPNFNYITYMLYGAFGIGNRGVHDPYVDFDEASKKPRLIAATNEYRQFLEFCHKLYSEGLLDNQIFTQSNAQYVAKQSEGIVGAFCYTNLATIPDSVGKNFKGIDTALKGPNGHQFWYPIRSDLHSTGAFVITTKNKHPEATMRWVDYFYSDEGNLLYNYGVEGQSHVKNPDGTYKFVKSVYDILNTSNLTFDAAVAPHVAVGGSNPLIVKEPYFYGREMDPVPARAAQNMVKYYPKEIWPLFIFSPKENYELTIIGTDVKTYIDRMRAEFITGRTSFDQWDNYIKQLKRMGSDDMLKIYENALKRMK